MMLQPHMMSADLLDHAGVAMQRKNDVLRQGDAAGSALSDLWDIIASQKRMLERESLDPRLPCGLSPPFGKIAYEMFCKGRK